MLHDCRNCRHMGNDSEDRCRGCWKGGLGWTRWEGDESPWIPANNPPEAGVEVMICTKFKSGSRNIEKGCWTGERYAHLSAAVVTHWTPIPELPKEEATRNK